MFLFSNCQSTFTIPFHDSWLASFSVNTPHDARPVSHAYLVEDLVLILYILTNGTWHVRLLNSIFAHRLRKVFLQLLWCRRELLSIGIIFPSWLPHALWVIGRSSWRPKWATFWHLLWRREAWSFQLIQPRFFRLLWRSIWSNFIDLLDGLNTTK